MSQKIKPLFSVMPSEHKCFVYKDDENTYRNKTEPSESQGFLFIFLLNMLIVWKSLQSEKLGPLQNKILTILSQKAAIGKLYCLIFALEQSAVGTLVAVLAFFCTQSQFLVKLVGAFILNNSQRAGVLFKDTLTTDWQLINTQELNPYVNWLFL